MLPHRRSARSVLAVYAVVTLVVLAAELLGSELAEVAGWFAAPLLAEALWLSTDPPRSRLARFMMLGFGFSFLGDAAPDLVPPGAAFLVMVTFFLLAQVSYVVGLWGLRRRSVARTWPRVVPYALAYLLVYFAVRDGAGALLLPVLLYAAVLAAMAVLATALGWAGALGGALFIVSDALLAMGRFTPGWDRPAMGAWIMATYLAAQALLLLGVLQIEERAR